AGEARRAEVGGANLVRADGQGRGREAGLAGRQRLRAQRHGVQGVGDVLEAHVADGRRLAGGGAHRGGERERRAIGGRRRRVQAERRAEVVDGERLARDGGARLEGGVPRVGGGDDV